MRSWLPTFICPDVGVISHQSDRPTGESRQVAMCQIKLGALELKARDFEGLCSFGCMTLLLLLQVRTTGP